MRVPSSALPWLHHKPYRRGEGQTCCCILLANLSCVWVPLTRGKWWQWDLYAERADRIRQKGSVVPADEGMHSRHAVSLHQLGVLLLSLSPSFLQNKLILKIECIYHHLASLQKTCLVVFLDTRGSLVAPRLWLFYFLNTISQHANTINQNLLFAGVKENRSPSTMKELVSMQND